MTYVLTVHCTSKRGIVAAVSGFLAEQGCNITDASQFDDAETGSFFARISFVPETGTGLDALREGFGPIGEAFGMQWGIHDTADRMKVVVNHDLPFHHIKVTKNNKPEAEAQLLQVVEDSGAELVVLARYMQILSDSLCQKMSGRIINIHHSFLPSFKGANPYRQAFERGVKLIGATSHYVTAELDEGPIIEQDTIRVTHAQSPDDYVSLGRDVESQVLARAVHAHIHRRAFLNGDKTVVFPASPGTYASERMG